MSMAVNHLFELVQGLRRPKVRPTPPFNAEGMQPPRLPVMSAVEEPAAVPVLRPPALPPVVPVAETYGVDEPPIMARPALPSAAIEPDEIIAPPTRPRLVPPETSRHPGTVDVATSMTPTIAPPLLKPVRRDTGDPLADESSFAQQIATYRPKNDNSRLKSIGLGALRGFGGGNIFGALTGALSHAADPSLDEQYHWGREGAQSQGRLGRLYGMREADQKGRYLESQIAENAAQAEAARRPKLPNYERVEGDDGFYLYDPANPTAPPLKLPVSPKAKPAAERNAQTITRRNADGSETVGYLDKDPQTGKPMFVPLADATGGVLRNAPKPSNVGPDGLTPGQRFSLKLRQEDREYRRGRDKAEDERNRAKFVADVAGDYTKRLTDAKGLLGDFEKYKALAASATKAEDRQVALDNMNAAFRALQVFSDVYELGEGGGSPYVKPRQGRSVSQVMRAKGITPDEATKEILDAGYVPTR